MPAIVPAPRKRFPVWSFALGFVAGIAFLYATAFIGDSGPHAREIKAEINGADVSRAGGAKLAIISEIGAVTQTCNGVCDSLRFEANSPDNVFRLEIRDLSGKCVLCDKGSYVTNGQQVQWTVAGQPQLRLKRALASQYSDHVVSE